MICNKCGSNEPDYALYCSKCGSRLESEAPVIPYAAPDDGSAGQARHESAPPTDSQSPYTGGQSPYAGGGDYRAYGSPASSGGWKGTVAMICGIASLPGCFTCWGGVLLGVAAIVFGILGLKTDKRGYAIAGIVCGAVGALMSLALIGLFLGMVNVYDKTDGFNDIFNAIQHGIHM